MRATPDRRPPYASSSLRPPWLGCTTYEQVCRDYSHRNQRLTPAAPISSQTIKVATNAHATAPVAVAMRRLSARAADGKSSRHWLYALRGPIDGDHDASTGQQEIGEIGEGQGGLSP